MSCEKPASRPDACDNAGGLSGGRIGGARADRQAQRAFEAPLSGFRLLPLIAEGVGEALAIGFAVALTPAGHEVGIGHDRFAVEGGGHWLDFSLAL